jgi:hypothetical protein
MGEQRENKGTTGDGEPRYVAAGIPMYLVTWAKWNEV